MTLRRPTLQSSAAQGKRPKVVAVHGAGGRSGHLPRCIVGWAGMKLHQIAEALGCRMEGDGEIDISGVLGMEQAGPGQLTFLANPKYAPKLRYSKAGGVIAAHAVEGIATLVSSNPYHDFARALELFYQPPRPAAGIHPAAAVS